MNKTIHFIGYYFPEAYFESNIENFFLVPFASNRLQESFLEYIERETRHELAVSSFLPVTDYPKSSFLWVRIDPDLWFHEIRISALSFLNLFIVKHLTKFISLFSHLLKTHFSTKKEIVYLVYNLNNVILIVLWLLNLIKRRKVIVIIADMPMAAMPDEGLLKTKLRSVDRWIVTSVVSSFDGLVVLSKHSAEDYFPALDRIVIEGILSQDIIDKYAEKPVIYPQENTITFTYIGRLSGSQNLDDAIREFQMCKRPELRFTICGKGELQPFIENAAVEDKRIILKGFVPNEEMEAIIESTDYFISPKKEDGYFSRYSFPSKIIEYMAYGKPVLTHKLSCLPEEYFEYLVFLQGADQEYLYFFNMCKAADVKHRDVGAAGKQFVIEKKNRKHQLSKINNII
jgi:glycosyltransferase involved in cell wall biosynthesis